MVDGRINNPPVFTSTPLLMYAGRARFRVGARRDTRIYNVRVPEWNRVDHYMEGSKHLAVPFGVDPAAVDWQPEIFLTDEERQHAEEKWKEASELVAQKEGGVRAGRNGGHGFYAGHEHLARGVGVPQTIAGVAQA